MAEEQTQDNPEAVGENSPYEAMLRGQETREQDLERTIRDRGRGFVMLFLVLLGSVYGNLYQLRLPKNVPIFTTWRARKVVTRMLLRPDEVPPEDPYQQASSRRISRNGSSNSRLRSEDTVLMVRGINSALRMSAGPARIKLSGEMQREDIGAGSNARQSRFSCRSSGLIPGNTWQAEWEEVVRPQVTLRYDGRPGQGAFNWRNSRTGSQNEILRDSCSG